MLPPTPISGHRLSSVVPAEVTDEKNQDHKLTNMDLSLKLHYIKGVYYFTSEAVQSLTIYELKKAMFPCLVLYYTASGRIRKSESGRPFIKCNDGGVRIVEAFCDTSIEEWMNGDHHNDNDEFDLAYDSVLGPDLGFSPLVYVQFTWFKCGGMAVGLSWAHILGDVISASNFINKWAQYVINPPPSKALHVSNTQKPENPNLADRKPFSVKRVDPVGDCWVTKNNCKMGTYSFHFSTKQLDKIVSESYISGLVKPVKISYFQIVSAIIWKSLSKIREDYGPNIVTICTRTSTNDSENEFPSNKLVFSIVQADFSAAKSGVDELATLIAEKQENENGLIEEFVECDNVDQMDYILYGRNLTFTNMEEANIYGLELNGCKPIYSNYSIKGVGEEGAVLVLPAGPAKRSDGRRVTVILPENQLVKLKNELQEEWSIV